MKGLTNVKLIFVRVIVTILILSALGLGVYFIFFKPASEDVVFLKLSEMMEYKDYQGNSYSANRRTGEKIALVRTGRRNNAVYNTANQTEYYKLLDVNSSASHQPTCAEIDEQLSGIFDYYFAYTQASKKVKKSVQNDIQKSIDSYLDAYDELNAKLNMIISLQDVINEKLDAGIGLIESDVNSYSTELDSRYLLVLNKYRACLKEYANLTLKVKDFVINYVFDGEPASDKNAVKNDIYLYVVQDAMQTEVNSENLTKISIGLKNIQSFSAFKMESVKMATAGSILYGKGIYTPRLVTETTEIEYVTIGNVCYRKMEEYHWYKCDANTFECDLNNELNYTNFTIETEDDKKYLTNGDDRYEICTYTKVGEIYSIVEIGGTNYRKNGGSWYKCANGSTDINYASLSTLNCTELTEIGYYKSTYTGDLSELRSSKLVEHYNYILNGGYLDKLKLALAGEDKVGFVANNLNSGDNTFSSIPKVCENSIKYILACYGFCVE